MRHRRNVNGGVERKEKVMYYLGTVIEKLVTPDSDVRRAERHHQRQRTARKRDHDRV